MILALCFRFACLKSKADKTLVSSKVVIWAAQDLCYGIFACKPILHRSVLPMEYLIKMLLVHIVAMGN